MAESLGTYYFQIAPSAEGVQGQISDMLNGSDSIGGVADTLSGSFSAALGLAGTAIAGVTAAATAMTGAVVAGGAAFMDMATSAAEYGDSVDKMSQKMGVSSEFFQEMDAVLKHSGTSMESLKASMKTMATAAQQGNEAFQALGISEEEVASMSQEDLFNAVITGLQNMEEGTERTYLASQLLGRGATELGALLNTSAEETQAMKDRLHELGGVMSDEDVKAAAQFQDSLQDMQTGFEGMQRKLVSGFLPSMSKVMDGMGDLFAGNNEKGLESLSDGVNEFIDNLSNLAPSLLSVGGNLVGTLTQSILTNLPTLITVGGEQLLALARGLVDSAPMLLSAGREIVETLLTTAQTMLPEFLVLTQDFFRIIAEGVQEALPTLLPMATDVIVTLIDTFVSIMPEGMTAGVALLEALGQGIVASLPALIGVVPTVTEALIQFLSSEALMFVQVGTYIFESLLSSENVNTIIQALIPMIPQITESLISALSESIPLFIEAGYTLFVALIENLPMIIVELCSAIPQIQDALLTALADLIVSFEDMGEQIMMGLADGLLKAGDAVVDTAKSVVGRIPESAKNLLQINSPSKLFEGYGEYIDMGLALGISNNADLPAEAMTSVSSELSTSYEPVEADVSVNSEGGGDIVIPVYIGNERIDEIIVSANDRVNYVSGGR